MRACDIETELEDLQKLSEQTASFTSNIYDWVSTLREHGLLDRLYEFNQSIEKRRVELTRKLDEAKKEEGEEDV